MSEKKPLGLWAQATGRMVVVSAAIKERDGKEKKIKSSEIELTAQSFCLDRERQALLIRSDNWGTDLCEKIKRAACNCMYSLVK